MTPDPGAFFLRKAVSGTCFLCLAHFSRKER